MEIKRIIKEILPYIIIVIIVVLVRSFLFTTVRVNGDSMKATLDNNDIMILDKINMKLKGIDRFDIIVFNAETDKKLIKRVIGLPGETVEYKDDKLYIDGKELKDEYGTGYTFDFSLDDYGIEKVPNDSYFVLGDNRENSVDSRILGSISKKDILGHAVFTIFPFKNFGGEE